MEIKGEVKKPDVYKIKSGSIVNDLIDMAGGTSINADMSSINRAAKLSDNQCIVIPKKGEKTTNAVNNPQVFPSSSSNSDEIQDKSVVNINTASKEELEKLPGIGATKAQRIIDYRVQKGAFKNIESIQNVSGIGEQTFENIKERITVQ